MGSIKYTIFLGFSLVLNETTCKKELSTWSKIFNMSIITVVIGKSMKLKKPLINQIVMTEIAKNFKGSISAPCRRKKQNKDTGTLHR